MRIDDISTYLIDIRIIIFNDDLSTKLFVCTNTNFLYLLIRFFSSKILVLSSINLTKYMI